MTTSCLLGEKTYPAEGITESEITAFVMRASDFNHALRWSELFRQFVFSSFGQPLADVITKMEQVAFGDIDNRLIETLIRRAGDSLTVTTTHQVLANELGTTREVDARHLKQFEKRGLLRLGRGTITINGRDALQELEQTRLM